jgi:hypothetical protein
LVAGMRNSGDHFGWDVKINNGFIIAGTEHDDHDENESNPLHEAGSAYIFQVDGTGTFNQIQKIVSSDRDSLDVFGYAIDIYGVNSITGAFQHDWNLTQTDSMQEAGAAYIWSSTNCSPIVNNQSAIICNGQSYTVGSSIYTTSGTYNDYFTAASGCDSIVITNLTVNPTYDTTVYVSICDGDSYTVGSSTYTTGGTYVDVLSTINTCDSNVTTVLTINPTYNINQSVAICAGDSYTVGTSTYSSTGIYTDSFTTMDGCDSIIVTDLTVNSIIDSTQNITICSGDSYTIGNSTYTTQGNYTDTLTSINGCDSIVYTNLTVVSQVDVSTTLLGSSAVANQNGATYHWLDCSANFQLINGATLQEFYPANYNLWNGNYACIVTLGSCSDTTECVYIYVESVEEQNLSNLVNIYPNPNTGQFFIKLDLNKENYSVKIMDVTGQIIYSKTELSKSKLVVDLNTIANGLYFVEVKTSEGKTTKKILIQK